MKFSKFRLIVVLLLFVAYIGLIIVNMAASPNMFWEFFSFQKMIRELIVILLFSIAFLLIPRIILRIGVGGLIIFPILYFTYFYLHNPFTEQKLNLFVHPQGFYQIKYPASWSVRITQNKWREVIFEEPGKNDLEKWDSVINSISIEYCSDKSQLFTPLLESECEARGTFEVNGQTAEAFYCKGCASSSRNAYIQISFPLKAGKSESSWVITIDRVWHDDDLFNPHQISPKRLLQKAWPILETFKLKKIYPGL